MRVNKKRETKHIDQDKNEISLVAVDEIVVEVQYPMCDINHGLLLIVVYVYVFKNGNDFVLTHYEELFS